MRTLILTALLLSLIPFSLYASARSNSGGLAERVAELEAQVAAMEEILQYVRVETEEIEGLPGPHWIFEGTNVHVRSGIGSTYRPLCIPDHPGCLRGRGLGNLVVGYNELPSWPSIRPGMHNLVVGPGHDYHGSGGFVAGSHNTIFNRSNSVTGGINNQAIGGYSTVSGGYENLSIGSATSVCGGHRNLAKGLGAVVSGGQDRIAPDEFDWAAGSLFEPN